MPHTTRVRADLARHLLSEPNDDLRRRISILRETPYAPGCHALAASEEWRELQMLLPDQQGFIYGASESALVFTYDSRANVVTILFGIVDGALVGIDAAG